MPPGLPIPKRGHSKRGARGESLSPVVYLWLRGLPGALGGPSLLACMQGGAGPGLAIRRRRANLLLASSALLGLSVGVPRVFGRALGGGFTASSRVRPARLRLLILLCPEWPSACAVGKYHEQTCWDPKDGELCLARMKPEETLVEVRSNSDVQIDCQSWV